jgi:hypothetical protein
MLGFTPLLDRTYAVLHAAVGSHICWASRRCWIAHMLASHQRRREIYSSNTPRGTKQNTKQPHFGFKLFALSSQIVAVVPLVLLVLGSG